MIEPDEAKPDTRVASPRSGNRRRAITVSVMFHLALIIALVCWYVPQHSTSDVKKENKTTSIPETQQRQLEATPKLPATSGDDVPASQIEASLKSAMKQVEELSEERQLSELKKNLRRLKSISSAESVQDTSQKIANTLGLSPGPVPAVESVEGTFDATTAQIHEVTRIRDANGEWLYQSVLVDAAGRTENIDLPRAEGEVTYKAFQQLKQFPMADGIYRQLVMPMLQNMLTAMDAAEAQARELRRHEAQRKSASQNSATLEAAAEGQQVPAKTDQPSSTP
jgi:hypothetical protein